MCLVEFDSAASMLREKTGVAERIKKENDKVIDIHCLCHSLNLAVSSVTKVSKHMKDAMDVCLELIKLIKHSSKRECLLNKFFILLLLQF